MKSYTIFTLVFFMAVFFSSCFDSIDKKMVVGQWNGVEWIVEGQPSEIDATSASFVFKGDGTYTYTYADATEKGKYFISGNELFTTPEGGIKMMVKIEKITGDSLVFNMNRGGTAETLTLVKAGTAQ
jgi:hypothetical protein